MALVNVVSVKLLNNPTQFSNPFDFQITFECSAPGIKGELDWKLVYVGSAGDSTHDQNLDSVSVGPVAIGKSEFVFEAPAPDPSRIPVKDLMDVTAILLSCSYLDKEFIRIGYYVNIDYGDNKELNENPPEVPVVDKLVRNVLQDKPLVTRFQIPWSDDAQELQKQALLEHQELEMKVQEHLEHDDNFESKEPEESKKPSDSSLSSKLDSSSSSSSPASFASPVEHSAQAAQSSMSVAEVSDSNDDNIEDEDGEDEDVEIDLEGDEEVDDEELEDDENEDAQVRVPEKPEGNLLGSTATEKEPKRDEHSKQNVDMIDD